jgi:hypothetical protein
VSRIGRRPIAAIKGVRIERKGTRLKVTGPKGELSADVPASITFEVGDAEVHVKRASDIKTDRVLHGTWRAILANMMRGVSDGFQRKLEIVGVGYKAEAKGRHIQFALGYSHPLHAAGGHQGRRACAHGPHRLGDRQTARRAGRREDPLVPSARAVQGEGREVRGRIHQKESRQGRGHRREGRITG